MLTRSLVGDLTFQQFHCVRASCTCTQKSSYRRVKGRSYTAEERTSMHSHRPHATSQPSLLSHTHSFTTQLAQPREPPHRHVPSWHEHWHCKATTRRVVTQQWKGEATPWKSESAHAHKKKRIQKCIQEELPHTSPCVPFAVDAL